MNPLFVRIVHEIYSRYGKAPFERGSQLSHNEIIIFFLWRRFSSKPNAYKSPEAILGLLKKYRNVPWTTRQRHGWMTLSISGRWDCIEMYGCKHADCPERQVLLYLKEKRIRGKRDPVIEDRLFQWGGVSKACARHVAFCPCLDCMLTTPRS